MKIPITSWCAAVLVAVSIAPASASILFSDLGASAPIYDCCNGWLVTGTASDIGVSFVPAHEFNSGTGGSVSQIDLGVGYSTGSNQFYASIWSEVAGVPTTQVPGALWNGLSAGTIFGNCCDLVTISGISGVVLAPHTNYFMILGPTSIGDTTDLSWNYNNAGALGLELYSRDGGPWTSNGVQTLAAFDVLGVVPEPSSMALLGAGLLGALGVGRRRRTQIRFTVR